MDLEALGEWHIRQTSSFHDDTRTMLKLNLFKRDEPWMSRSRSRVGAVEEV